VQRLATAAYKLLQEHCEAQRDAALATAFEREPLLLVPGAGGESRWCRSAGCMWVDVPTGSEVRRASLASHYPSDLRSCFVDRCGVSDVDTGEVVARISGIAASSGSVGSRLGAVYEQVDRFCRASGWTEHGSACSVFAACIFVVGRGFVAVDDCVFFPREEYAGIAELAGKIDLRIHYPGQYEFFVNSLGVRDHLDVDACLLALGKLQDCKDADARRLAAVLYRLLSSGWNANDKGMEAAKIKEAFAEKPLLFTPNQKHCWHYSDSCMWYDVPSGIEVGCASLESYCHPDTRAFFVGVLGVAEVNAGEVVARLHKIVDGDALLAEDYDICKVGEALSVAYDQLHSFCHHTSASGSGREVWSALVAASTVLVPGIGPAPTSDCVFLPDECTGLAALGNKVDLSRHYPKLRSCFVEHMGVRDYLTPDEGLALLRALRDSASSALPRALDDGETQRMCTAVYKLLEEGYGSTPQVVDLGITFEEERLLFVPRPPSAPAGAGQWCHSAACMWHDSPSGVGCHRVSLQPCSPPALQQFFVEVLGVRAADADEVLARLDALKKQGSDLPRFMRAYAELHGMSAERSRRGVQFWDPDLLAGLQKRVFVPDHGFVTHATCIWNTSPAFGRAAKVVGRHNLHELYAAAETGVPLLPVSAYFVEWLRVPEHLTPEECLGGLRALSSDGGKASASAAGADGDEASPYAAARSLYGELAHALKAGGQEETKVASNAFLQEPLVYVPGPSGGRGRWHSTEQCLWAQPEEIPQGWALARAELAPHFGDDDALRALFTERLGVPMSVHFSTGQDAEMPTQPTPNGQPFWLLASAEGKKMVPRPRPRSPPRPKVPAASDAESQADGGGDIPPQVARAFRKKGTGEDGEDTQNDDPGPPERDGDGEDEERKPPPPAGFYDKNLKSVSAVADREREKREEKARTFNPVEEEGFPQGDNSQVIGEDDAAGVPPPPEPSVPMRGVATDGRRERQRLLAKLARSVMTSNSMTMSSSASRQKHRPDEALDCNPHHDLERVAVLEGTTALGEQALIPVWVERTGRSLAIQRVQAAVGKSLEKFAGLILSLTQLFNVSPRERVHIFEEDTQTVAFNGGALFFNLRYFVEERHADSWEDAVCFWTISFAHELAHFESVIHDRRHGRAMEHAQRAVLPGLPRVLACPWGAAEPGRPPSWRLRRESSDPL